MTNELFNIADEDQLKERDEELKKDQDQETADMKAILATDSGKRFIRRLLRFCGVFQTSFTGNSRTFFLEGQRNVGLMLITEIGAIDKHLLADLLVKDKKGEQ